MDKTYPIGTKIKYVGYCKKCKDKTGKIMRVYEHSCRISLPQSTCTAATSGSIICNWDDIELLIKKNQQLLFAFMD